MNRNYKIKVVFALPDSAPIIGLLQNYFEVKWLGIDFEEEEYEAKEAARNLEIIEEFPVKAASDTSIEAVGREDGEAA